MSVIYVERDEGRSPIARGQKRLNIFFPVVPEEWIPRRDSNPEPRRIARKNSRYELDKRLK